MAGQGGTDRPPRDQQAADLARDLILFADGLEEAGMIGYARRARVVARDTIWLVEALQAERSARQAIQADRDRCLQILADHASEALERTA